ncbi:MAG: hypothetical protein NTV19_16775 [Burkholderiales bacterium]|nr:hypothetical protein [Burkholderiales bacterium]
MNDKIATPVPAATIQVFMVVRHHQIDFASGALVFPGGKADRQDSDDRVISRLGNYPNASTEQSMLRAAAIREAFEESGILLARRRAGSALVANGDLDRWRAGLNGHTLTLGDMLAEGDLELACDDLAHFSHWITPEFMPKRFDTHFYLARVPVDQVAGHDGHENVDSVWITPRQVIEAANEKRRTVIFPTLSNVVRLAQFGSVAEAFSAAQTSTIVPIRPRMEDRADGKYVCIPTDAGFALTEQKASR